MGDIKLTEDIVAEIYGFNTNTVTEFFTTNNLLGMPLSLVKDIEGDYLHYISRLKRQSITVDSNRTVTFDAGDFSYSNTYDERGNLIHYKTSDGYEWWKEYDDRGNLIHCKGSNGTEWQYTYEYCDDGQLKSLVHPNGEMHIPWFEKE